MEVLYSPFDFSSYAPMTSQTNEFNLKKKPTDKFNVNNFQITGTLC